MRGDARKAAQERARSATPEQEVERLAADPCRPCADEAFIDALVARARDLEVERNMLRSTLATALELGEEYAATVERVRELADDLAEFNPGHGDYLTAARRIRAALDPEEPRRD